MAEDFERESDSSDMSDYDFSEEEIENSDSNIIGMEQVIGQKRGKKFKSQKRLKRKKKY